MASSTERNAPHILGQATPSLAVLSSSAHSTAAGLNFDNRRCLGKFRTTDDGTYSTLDVKIPRLISDLHKVTGIYLGTDLSQAVLIPNYSEFHHLKQKFFLQWILDNNFFTEVARGKYKKPEFVCSGSCVYFPMMTPSLALYGSWEFYAVKICDVIYLWGENHSDAGIGLPIEMYYGIYFEHLLTHEIPTVTCPNEYEKVFVVNEVRFGSHQLLCLSEIDAQDDNEEWVEIKVFRQAPAKAVAAKHFRCWAQSIVSGVPSLVLGKRDDEGKLLQATKTTTDDLARRFNLNPNPYYDFQDRLLTWIKSHFQESNAEKVKKISWPGLSKYDFGPPDVRVSDVPKEEIPEAFLPNWYVKSLEN